MPFTANIGEEVVDLKTGGRFKVADAPLELDEAKYGRAQGAVGPADVKAGMAGQTAPLGPEFANLPPAPSEAAQPQGPSGRELMQQAQQKSVQEAGQVSRQLMTNVAVPAAQVGLGLATGGMSIPAQMAIGGGGEFLAQQAGLAPSDPGQVALQAAIPGVGRALAGGARGLGRAIANVTGRGQQAGEQAIAGRLNVPLGAVERSTFAPSRGMFEQARQSMPNLSKAQMAIRGAIDEEMALGSQANKQTVKTLEGIGQDLVDLSVGGVEDSKVMVAKAQRLGKQADQAFRRGNTTLASTLKGAVDEFKRAIPGLKEADAAYTREDVVDKIFKAARKGKKVEAIDNLLADEGAKIRGVIPDDDIKAIRTIASQIENVTQGEVGVTKTAFNTLVKSFLSDPNGVTFMRHAFGPSVRFTPERLAAFATFMRGYLAQQQRDQEQQRSSPLGGAETGGLGG